MGSPITTTAEEQLLAEDKHETSWKHWVPLASLPLFQRPGISGTENLERETSYLPPALHSGVQKHAFFFFLIRFPSIGNLSTLHADNESSTWQISLEIQMDFLL